MTTVYRSSDASAPVLTGVAGSLFDVLDACLVNGYGAKSAAGWTKPFSDATNAVYRTDTVTGIGCYVRVTQGAANTYEIRAYESMTDAVTGLFPTDVSWAYVSATTNGTVRPWDLIADARTFYMRPIIDPSSFPSSNVFSFSNVPRFFGAGEYEKADALNNHNYFVAGGNVAAGGPLWLTPLNRLGVGTRAGASVVHPAGDRQALVVSVSDVPVVNAGSLGSAAFASIAMEPFNGVHRLFPLLIGGNADGARYLGRLRGVSVPSVYMDSLIVSGTGNAVLTIDVNTEFWWTACTPSSTWRHEMTGVYVHLSGDWG